MPNSPPRGRSSRGRARPRPVALGAAVVLAAGLIAGAGGRAGAESLREALAAAYFGNPAIQAERARQRSEDESVHQAISEVLPRVSLEAHTGYEHNVRHPPGWGDRRYPERYGVRLEQSLFKGLRNLNATRRAEANVLAGQAQLDDKEQSVLLEAATAFADVFRDREIVRLLKENVRFLRAELKATRIRVREGDLTKTDVAQARSRVQKGLSDLAQAEADLEASSARFAALIGHLPGPLAKPPPIGHLLPASFADALATAERENPAVQSAALRSAAARFQTREAYGELLPTVTLDAFYGKEEDHRDGVDHEDERSVFVRMKMPLYQGGKVRSEVRESRQTEVQRRFEVTDTRSRVKARLQDAWKQRRAALARIRAERLQVEAAREALKGVKIEASVGERAFFEVLDAQRELVNARVGLKRAERDLVVASFSLLAATGRLTPSHLELPVADYDPAANYAEVRFTPFGLRRGPRPKPAAGRAGLRLPPGVAPAPAPAPAAVPVHPPARAVRKAEAAAAPATGRAAPHGPWRTKVAMASGPRRSSRARQRAAPRPAPATPWRTKIVAAPKRRTAAKAVAETPWRTRIRVAPKETRAPGRRTATRPAAATPWRTRIAVAKRARAGTGSARARVKPPQAAVPTSWLTTVAYRPRTERR